MYNVLISKYFVIFHSYSSELEEIQKETIPVPSKIVKSNVQKINNQVFAVTLMLQYDQRYLLILIQII